MDGGRPPDFVGVGAQRCGTTWWYELIVAHPQVEAGAKERHFFNRFCAEPMGDADVEAYRAAFPRPAGQLGGEWTPRYAYDFWTPALLRRAAPDAKLLFMLRDPVERLRSGVVHQFAMTPPAGDPVALAGIYADAAARCHYGSQLGRLLEHFPREQVLVLQYERCVADPAAELRRTHRFLGLGSAPFPDDLVRLRGNPSREKPALPDAVRLALSEDLAEDAILLSSLAPEIDPGLWWGGEERHAAGQ